MSKVLKKCVCFFIIAVIVTGIFQLEVNISATDNEIIKEETSEEQKEDIQGQEVSEDIGFIENIPTDIPTYYESKIITTGDGSILYSFKGRNGTNYYRVYGSKDGGVDAFYETNSQGIITSVTPIDTTVEETSIAPYLLVGETYTSVPITITKEEAISTTVGYGVYSFDGADGNKIYVAYGHISNISDPELSKGWYELDATTYKGKDLVNGKQDDIDKFILNHSVLGFLETAAPSNVPDYYGAPVKMEKDHDTLITRERVYAFTAKDGFTYYRVYGTINGSDEGFYDSDAHGNVKALATKIDLEDEDKNLKPTNSKPGGKLGEDEAYVSSIAVNTIRDGTSVWDADDSPGNDSSNSNGIIRTFDKIGYTIDANIQVRTSSGYTSFSSGYAYFRVTLPYTSDIVEFSLDDMKWIEDAKIEEVDGKQILTGKRYFAAAPGETVFPGTRQFPFEVKVNGAKNGDIIRPFFEVWMDGNAESEYKSIFGGDGIKVSAAPNYNIELQRNTSMSWKDDFDFSTGNPNAANKDAGIVTGRLYGYGVNIELRNYNASKGLKGIELPKGKITFELELGAFKNGADVTGKGAGKIMPLLWDYKANSGTTTGNEGRNMMFNANGFGNFAYYISPYNKGGLYSSVVDAGTWDAKQTNETITVEVDAYKFLTEKGNYHWPTHGGGTTSHPSGIKFGEAKGRGVFSTGYFEILFPFENDIGKGGDYNLVVSDKNFQATSISDTKTTTQVITDDDSRNVEVVLLPPGSYNKLNYFTKESQTAPWGIGNNLSTGYGYNADGWAAKGQTLRIFGGIAASTSMDEEQYPRAVNILQKFDTTAFQPLDDAKEDDCVVYRAGTMKFKLRYGAKPDGTGWNSDMDMNTGKEEDLIFFTIMAELKATLGSKAVCVAVLIEGRNGKIPVDRSEIGFKVKMLDTAEAGKVYQTVNNLKIWTQENGEKMSFDDSMLYYNQSGHETSTDYMDDPDVFLNGTIPGPWGLYKKTEYDSEGQIKTGTHAPNGYQSGASALIVGYTASIKKAVAQQSGGKSKDVFDLDAGQRKVDFVLQPSLTLANGEKPDQEAFDNVKIVDTLPFGTTYVEGSTTFGGTYNQDKQMVEDGNNSTSVQPVVGTTNDAQGRIVQTLTWELTKVKVGEEMDAIRYSIIIGNIADSDNDAKHNDSFINSVKIHADGDGRAISPMYGNTYQAGFTVTKTNATTFAKGINQNMYELGEDIGYSLMYANTSQNSQANVRIFDILPYTGDWRGTKFDGSYIVDSVTLEYSTLPTSTLDLSFSQDSAIRNQSTNAYNVDATSFTSATKTQSGNSVTYTIPAGSNPTAFYFHGNMDGQTTIKISYKLKVSGNKPSNIYANDATMVAAGSSDPLYAPIVQAKVVRRSIEGIAWVDSNRNGKRETSEKKLPDVKVSLYKSDGTQVTTDILGNDLTGVVTASDGSYSFANLPSGDYYVQFDSSSSVDLSQYILTTKQASGVNTTLNSDAEATLDASGKLLSAKISGITTPMISDMKVMDHRSSNLDMGVYTLYTIEKTSDPAGSMDGTNIPVIKEGQVITYKITLNSPIESQKDVTIQDAIPEGMSVINGSIYYKLQGRSATKVSDSAYNSSTRTITWPTLDVLAGKTEYTFQVVVDKVVWGENETEKEYQNIAISKQPSIPDLPSNEVTHKTLRREADITKAAALVKDDGTVLAEDNGTANAPVYSELGQTIEYHLVVKNMGDDEAISGNLIVSDVLPLDTTYVAGSMSATFRDSANPTTAFVGSSATVTMSNPDSSGKMTWTLNGLHSGEEAYLTFRVKAPITSDNAITLVVKELEKEFDNTATLKDVQKEETLYQASYTDVNGVTHTKEENVFSETEITKQSNTTYHVVKEPLLTITKNSNVNETYVSSEDEITYSITVTNVGKAVAKEFDIKDAIPKFTKYVEGSISYSGDATTVTSDDSRLTEGTGELTWKVEELAVNKSVMVTFKVKVEKMKDVGEREILNQAYTRLPEDPWTPSNEIEHKQEVAYEIEKDSNPKSGSYVDGKQEITYTIKVTNTGKSTLDNLQVKDMIPTYTTYVEESISYEEGKAILVTPDDSQIVDNLGTLTWDIEGLPVGETITVTFKVKVDEMNVTGERAIVNQANAKTPEQEDWTPTNEIEHKQKMSYEIEKESDPESGTIVKKGDIITYFINVTNTGNEILREIQVKDVVPKGTIYEDNSMYSSLENTIMSEESGNLSWEIEEIKPGEIGVVSFRVKVDGTTQSILNVANVEVGEDEPKDTNEVEHEILPEKGSVTDTSDTTNMSILLGFLGVSIVGIIGIRRSKKNRYHKM